MVRRLPWFAAALLTVALSGCAAFFAPQSASPEIPNSAGPSANPSEGPLPIIDPLATPFPSLAPGTLDASTLGWQTVIAELDTATSELIGHWLAVGTLDKAEPVWFEPIMETPWRFELFATQQPVVDGPAAGVVLFVSDDGATSAIWTVAVDGFEPRLALQVPDVVYAARLAPDGQSAYLVLLDRGTGQDNGLWRVELTGDVTAESVMPPPAVDLAGLQGRVRLIATTRFVRTVRISADGSLVARMACGEPFGQCVLDVLSVANGQVTAYEPAEQSGDLTAIGDGVILGIDHCLDESRCVTEGIRLPGSDAYVFPGTPPAVDERGHLVLLQFPSATVEGRRFYATNLDGSDRRLVFVSDGGVRIIHQDGVDFEGVRIEIPWGWVAVYLDWPTDGGGYRVIPAAVRLADGGWVPLTLPQIYPIGGGHD